LPWRDSISKHRRLLSTTTIISLIGITFQCVFSAPFNPLAEIKFVFSSSSCQISDKAHQNEHATIDGTAIWLNTSSDGVSSINHGQCPTCLRAYPVAGVSAGNQQYQNDNLLGLYHQFPYERLPTPEKFQYKDGMTSAVGGAASPNLPATQHYPSIQYFEAQNLKKAKQSLPPPTCNKTKSKLTLKQPKRKSSNTKCEPCNRFFTRAYDRQRHWLSQHSGNPVRWPCTYCKREKSYCREDKLKDHLRKHHPEFNTASPGA
jgi:hypothetical protein